MSDQIKEDPPTHTKVNYDDKGQPVVVDICACAMTRCLGSADPLFDKRKEHTGGKFWEEYGGIWNQCNASIWDDWADILLPPSSRPEVSGAGVQEVEGGGGESRPVDLGLLEGDVQHIVPYASDDCLKEATESNHHGHSVCWHSPSGSS